MQNHDRHLTAYYKEPSLKPKPCMIHTTNPTHVQWIFNHHLNKLLSSSITPDHTPLLMPLPPTRPCTSKPPRLPPASTLAPWRPPLSRTMPRTAPTRDSLNHAFQWCHQATLYHRLDPVTAAAAAVVLSLSLNSAWYTWYTAAPPVPCLLEMAVGCRWAVGFAVCVRAVFHIRGRISSHTGMAAATVAGAWCWEALCRGRTGIDLAWLGTSSCNVTTFLRPTVWAPITFSTRSRAIGGLRFGSFPWPMPFPLSGLRRLIEPDSR